MLFFRFFVLSPLIFIVAGCVSFAEQDWQEFVSADSADLCSRNLPAGYPSYDALPLFFITSRLPDCRNELPQFTVQRGDMIRYGRYQSAGTTSNPKPPTIAFRDENNWRKDVNSALGPSGRVIVYIHGYNSPFDETAARTDAVRRVTNFDGPVISYTWPNFETFSRYTVDEANNLWDQPYFYGELLALARNDNVKDIIVISHSMGTRSLLAAMERMSRQSGTRQYLSKFNNLIFASGDVDRQIFERAAKSELFSENMMGADRHITVFASAVDRAVGISRILHGYDRLGITKCNDPRIKEPCYPRDPETNAFFDGVTIVDTSDVSGGFIGHADFIDSEIGREFMCAAVLDNGKAMRKLPKLVKPSRDDPRRFCENAK